MKDFRCLTFDKLQISVMAEKIKELGFIYLYITEMLLLELLFFISFNLCKGSVTASVALQLQV